MLWDDIASAFPQGGALLGVDPEAFRETFDAIPLAILAKSLRPENFGRFVLWNKEAEAALGIPAEEAIGARDSDFFPGDQVAFFEAKDREAMASGRPMVIPAEPIITRTRGMRMMRTLKVPIRDPEGRPAFLLLVVEDVTDMRAAVPELQHALDLINSVNSELPGAVYQFRVDRLGRADFPYVSEGIRFVSGDAAADIMSGKVNLLSRLLPDDLPIFLSQVARSRAEMNHSRQEFRLRTRHGEIRWVMASALPKNQPDGSTIWHGFLSDITSLKQASEAQRRGEERLRSALRATRAAAWEHDLASGDLYLSPEWHDLFGPDETPRSISDLHALIHPDDHEAFRQVVERENGEGDTQVEIRHRNSNGEYLWVMVSGQPVLDADGQIVRRVGTIMDVTDRRRIKEQLIEAKEAAERASQAKGEFLAMMSHEIRTPLNAVLGFSELLASMPLGAEQADHLRTIRENSSALMVVLNDVLDYSKIESGKLDLHPAPVDISRLVRSVADFFRPQARTKGLKLNALFAGDIPDALLCDSARLNQILHNLLSNALKFTERGGITVQLSLSGPPEDGLWPIVLRVEDTGIGIALDRHTSLFDPFYQADSSTRRRFGGTGLGLTIVRKLVSLMGGNIEVSSQPGRGTKFTLYLRFEEPESEDLLAEERTKRVSINIAQLMPKILVVEDNATNRRLVKLFLKRLGHEADEAENGFQSVEMAAATHYDVIFMDLEMPGMDGYEATRLIREMKHNGSPYIVALTAHAMPEYRERSLQAGMDGYLSKPVKQDDLKKTLRTALRR